MIIFFIILGLVVVGIILGTLIYKHNKKIRSLREKYVNNFSASLKALSDINSKYSFFNPEKRNLVYEIYLKSKKAFNNFNCSNAIYNIFYNNRSQIKSLMHKVTKDRIMLQQYNDEIKKIPTTNLDYLPKEKYINSQMFDKIEKDLLSKSYLKIDTSVSLTIHWSYKSPAGRNYYENHCTLGYDEIIELYLNYFSEDLRNVEENEEIADIMNSVIKDITKDVYKINEIISIYKKHGVSSPPISLAESTLYKLGFVKRKNSDYYVHFSVKNIKDMILVSANEEGLITYENKIKDKDYDNEIDKLEKEGRIIPIDNLHFLKVGKKLNYKGVTIQTIEEFEFLLKKFSKKEVFVSIKQVCDNVDSIITKNEFDECFVASIMKYCGFLFQVPGIEKLYTIIQKPQRIDFLEWLLKDKESVDAYDLIYDLKELYGIEYNINSIIYDIDKSKTDLYYNQEMEKIYSNKECFFKELEDVL